MYKEYMVLLIRYELKDLSDLLFLYWQMDVQLSGGNQQKVHSVQILFRMLIIN